MKNSRMRRPEVESLESVMLLSTLTPLQRLALASAVPASQATQASATNRVRIIGGAATPASAFTGSTHHVQVIGGVATPASSFVSSTRRVQIIGGAATPATSAATSTHRVQIIGGAISPGQGGTVHAMIVAADSKPVVITQATTTPTVASALAKDETLVGLGRAASGLRIE